MKTLTITLQGKTTIKQANNFRNHVTNKLKNIIVQQPYIMTKTRQPTKMVIPFNERNICEHCFQQTLYNAFRSYQQCIRMDVETDVTEGGR